MNPNANPFLPGLPDLLTDIATKLPPDVLRLIAKAHGEQLEPCVFVALPGRSDLVDSETDYLDLDDFFLHEPEQKVYMFSEPAHFGSKPGLQAARDAIPKNIPKDDQNLIYAALTCNYELLPEDNSAISVATALLSFEGVYDFDALDILFQMMHGPLAFIRLAKCLKDFHDGALRRSQEWIGRLSTRCIAESDRLHRSNLAGFHKYLMQHAKANCFHDDVIVILRDLNL